MVPPVHESKMSRRLFRILPRTTATAFDSFTPGGRSLELVWREFTAAHPWRKTLTSDRIAGQNKQETVVDEATKVKIRKREVTRSQPDDKPCASQHIFLEKQLEAQVLRDGASEERRLRLRVQNNPSGAIRRPQKNVDQTHGGRPSGGKDRHSKVNTAKGLRDRRVRLSASTAIQFFDVQDRLGFDQPSKAVDWLIKKAKSAIDELAKIPDPETPKKPEKPTTNANMLPLATCELSKKESEQENGSSNQALEKQQVEVRANQGSSGEKGGINNSSDVKSEEVGSGSCASGRAESRAKARERARERAKKKSSASKPSLSADQLLSADPAASRHESSFPAVGTSVFNSEDGAGYGLPARGEECSAWKLTTPSMGYIFDQQQDLPYQLLHVQAYLQAQAALQQQQTVSSHDFVTNACIGSAAGSLNQKLMGGSHHFHVPPSDVFQSLPTSLPFGSLLDAAGITSMPFEQHTSLPPPHPCLLSAPATEEHFLPTKHPNPQTNAFSSHASSTDKILMTSQAGPGPPCTHSASVPTRGTLQSSFGPIFYPPSTSFLAQNALAVNQSELKMLTAGRTNANYEASAYKVSARTHGVDETVDRKGLLF